MNKTLKIVCGIVAGLLVIYLIAGLAGSRSFRTERSVVIHAQPHEIYTHISDYRHWPEWSPWYELDTACRYEYFGTQGEADAGYRWNGNNKAGAGEMRTIEAAQDMKLVSRINFLRPFKSEAHATFTLDSVPGGDTKVTWAFAQEIGFLMRPVMLFFDMEKMIGSDFEKGLSKLKKVCEATTATQEVMTVQLPAKTYIAYRVQTSTDSAGILFPIWMPQVYAYVQSHKLEMDGPPAGLYYTWDPEHKKTDMAIAIPVKKAPETEGTFRKLTIPATRAVMANYYGPYDEKMSETHALLNAFITDQKLKKRGVAIESYVTDPGTEKDPNKVLTEIYYPVE